MGFRWGPGPPVPPRWLRHWQRVAVGPGNVQFISIRQVPSDAATLLLLLLLLL